MDTQDAELTRLKEQQDALNATKTGQQQRLETLQSEREVLKDLAGSGSFDEGQPESGPRQQPSDPFLAAAAQEQLARKEGQIAETTADLANTKTALGANEKAQSDRKVEIEGDKVEQRMNTTEVLTDRLAESTDQIAYQMDQFPDTPNAPDIDVGGTGKHLGEAVAWTREAIIPAVQTLGVIGTIETSINAVGARYAAQPSDQQPEWHKIEAEEKLHQQQIDDIQQTKGKVVSELESKGAQMGTEPTFAEVKDFHATATKGFAELEQKFKEQDAQTAALYQNNTVEDPGLRTVQMQERAVNEQSMHANRYGATREIAEAVAVKQVELSNADQLKQNEARLERQCATPDAMEASMSSLKNLQTEQRGADVYEQTNKIHAQQCPEMAMNPPEISQSGPGGSGAGSAMAPQQTGPGGGGAGGGGPQLG